MKGTIRCQEEVSRNKSTYKSTKSRPEPFAHIDGDTHQCTMTAKYKINSIDLYVCGLHANGIDKSQLIKI